jgi:hypothetical protein
MEITNLKTDHEWQHISCQKNESCFHCKCKKQYDSIPKNDFNVNETDNDGNITQKTITKITIDYGNKDEILGWYF